MNALERGVLPGSTVYFHTHSDLAQELFFYPLCVGHFICNETYVINRSNYDSFLMLYTASGKGIIRTNGKELSLNEGSLILIDCYQPHFYASVGTWEIYWLHFDGTLARRYFEQCTQDSMQLPPNGVHVCARRLLNIYFAFHQRNLLNEVEISRNITDLLTEWLLFTISEVRKDRNAGLIEETLNYISEHVDQSLTVEGLSRRVALSPYYFLRLFKKKTGTTPHEYMVRARMDKARYLLKSTDIPIKEIAYQTGFSSECSFCTTFKKRCGSTPLRYRIGGSNE